MYKGLYIQRYIRRKERARTFKGEILFFFFLFTLPQTQYNSCYGRWAGLLGSERSRLYTLSASLSAMNPWPIHHIRSKGHYICEHSPMIINILEELQQHLSILLDKSMTQVFCFNMYTGVLLDEVGDSLATLEQRYFFPLLFYI